MTQAGHVASPIDGERDGERRRPVALVTGATRGIGEAIAHELSRTHHVLVGGREPRAVAEAAARIPGATPFVADLTDERQLAEAARSIRRLDVLVHSAAVLGGHDAIAESSRERFRRAFELNVFAVADLTRLLLPLLRTSEGTIVMINSGSGYASGAGTSVYSGTKFALRALTDALREEERQHGVRVSSIHPGRVDTDMQRELRQLEQGSYERERYLTPQAVAQAVRLAVDTPAGGAVDELKIRPMR
ncbi:SDR family oxidoreductase [Pseudoclavibacter sp. RFBB5]|jgi:NADP-dependent 3-hydroxy acid dehydrogenase YdfG|uniref:SDR family oxidoreductase n=1 Tax=Pseudoclavibacter sp. RFBB5 TaxID=2080574 RepID=UPI000CE8D535|nr:SDR family oxidoreductase [Pseudoclavibacter sp. RFBB5]PPG27030.1 short chain dehydrogenase [Pseudoclavibacter sp. RFBB5]